MNTLMMGVDIANTARIPMKTAKPAAARTLDRDLERADGRVGEVGDSPFNVRPSADPIFPSPNVKPQLGHADTSSAMGIQQFEHTIRLPVAISSPNV